MLPDEEALTPVPLQGQEHRIKRWTDSLKVIIRKYWQSRQIQMFIIKRENVCVCV